MPDDADRPDTAPTTSRTPRCCGAGSATAVRPWLGWILIGVGALLMLLGYFGVSREALPGKQIPYLVSGGIGGMFLAVLGAYFLGTQELRSDSGRLDRLERMVEELHERAAAPARRTGPHRATARPPAPAAAEGPSRRVVAVDGRRAVPPGRLPPRRRQGRHDDDAGRRPQAAASSPARPARPPAAGAG